MTSWRNAFGVALRVTFLSIGWLAFFIVVVFFGLAILGSTSQGIYAGMAVAIVAGITVMVGIQAVMIKFTVEEALREFVGAMGTGGESSVPSGKTDSVVAVVRCTSCQAIIPDGASFCVYCGTRQR